MPVGSYYGGHGREVMSNMQRQYGSEKGKRVFYATANKRKGSALAKAVRKHRRRKRHHR